MSLSHIADVNMAVSMLFKTMSSLLRPRQKVNKNHRIGCLESKKQDNQPTMLQYSQLQLYYYWQFFVLLY